MFKYTEILGLKIASYGLIVFMGIVICSCIAKVIAEKQGHSLKRIFTVFFIGGIGAFIGAKLLTLISLTVNTGVWSITFREFSKAGLSYYGGLWAFLGSVYFLGKSMRIETAGCLDHYVFLLPLLHFFWKISCFMGGCCFGIPYEGPGSVIFPEGVNALSGTPVFPIQLVEAFTALIISVVLLVISRSHNSLRPAALYLVLYGITRFVLEFFRFHVGTNICNAFVYSIISVMIGVVILKRDLARSMNQ